MRTSLIAAALLVLAGCVLPAGCPEGADLAGLDSLLSSTNGLPSSEGTLSTEDGLLSTGGLTVVAGIQTGEEAVLDDASDLSTAGDSGESAVADGGDAVQGDAGVDNRDDRGADSDEEPAAELDPRVAEIVALVNTERAAVGAGPLTLNLKLTAAAQGHAQDMVQNDFFAHTGSDGSSVGDRVTAQGYAWLTVGENIAYGPASAQTVMLLWMSSPGHKANILNPAFVEIGVGIDATGATHWVQVFAAPQ